MCTPSVQLSARTWPIRSVQVQLDSSGPISMIEPKLRVASGSQEDPGQRRAEQEAPRERPIPLTTEALAARDDSLQHLRRRVAVSISRSACPASSSTAVGGPEEQDELRRRMEEYPLHEEYYKSVRGKDGEDIKLHLWLKSFYSWSGATVPGSTLFKPMRPPSLHASVAQEEDHSHPLELSEHPSGLRNRSNPFKV